MRKSYKCIFCFFYFFVFWFTDLFISNYNAIAKTNPKHNVSKQNSSTSYSPLYDNLDTEGNYTIKENSYQDNEIVKKNKEIDYYPTRFFTKFGAFIGTMYYPSNSFLNLGLQLDATLDTRYITPFIGIKFDFSSKLGYRSDSDVDLDVFYNSNISKKTRSYYTLSLRIGNKFIVSKVHNIYISPYIFCGAFFHSQNYKYYRTTYRNEEESELRHVNLIYGAGVDFELNHFMIKVEYRRIGKVLDSIVPKRNVNAVTVDIGFLISF